MQDVELLRKLGTAAEADLPGRVQVVAQVMAAVSQPAPVRDPVLWLAAIISSALATTTAVVAVLQLYSVYNESLEPWLATLEMVMQ
ncbi:MAG: hypothetical protein WCJ97_04105 [Phycisphaerae bacterium]